MKINIRLYHTDLFAISIDPEVIKTVEIKAGAKDVQYEIDLY